MPETGFYCLKLNAVLAGLLCALPLSATADATDYEAEIVVVAATPGGGTLAADKLPFNVQSAGADSLQRAQALDLSDFLATELGSVNINSAQNNPLQPDVQYRGYAASPLLGLSQGVVVYQGGARINEPLGDAINWDLVPESAIHRLSLVGGSNPLFGLNTLGGAITVEMKNGFNYTDTAAELSGGAWSRISGNVESGGNDGRFGYYINVSYFEEDGWRDLSASDALNVFGNVSYRDERASADLSFQHGDTLLRGNGALPRGLLAVDRDAVFTAPDITENELYMGNFQGDVALTDELTAALNGFYRHNSTASFNGDGSDFLACRLGAETVLLDGVEDDDLDELGLDEDAICEDNVLAVNSADELEDALNALAGADTFNLDPTTADDLSGSGQISDSAINNISDRSQRSYGADAQLRLSRRLFSQANHLVAGFSFFRGTARFDSVTELARIDPLTRNTLGLGVGSFVNELATQVNTSTRTLSLYFSDSLDLGERLTVTFGGRYNTTDVRLRDRSGARPELDGDHVFNRFNPTAGFTFDLFDNTNVFASYSESARAPTPIELACNEGVFEIARANAIARGDDPQDIEFECRLPNAFLADPPLQEVVAKTVEFGLRGTIVGVNHRLGYFRTDNRNDIIFQTTGRGTGLFANVDKTRRQGFESAFNGSLGAFDWRTSYSLILATFEDDFNVLSPNHPAANDDGELAVRAGARIPGIPAHQFKFSGDYLFPREVRLGFEVIYNSGQYLRGDEANLLARTDGYAVVNVRGSYRPQPRVEIFAKVTNLFDTNYENFGLIGEAPGDILPDLADQSPRFLGVGAPVAGWVGIRLTL